MVEFVCNGPVAAVTMISRLTSPWLLTTICGLMTICGLPIAQAECRARLPMKQPRNRDGRECGREGVMGVKNSKRGASNATYDFN